MVQWIVVSCILRLAEELVIVAVIGYHRRDRHVLGTDNTRADASSILGHVIDFLREHRLARLSGMFVNKISELVFGSFRVVEAVHEVGLG